MHVLMSFPKNDQNTPALKQKVSHLGCTSGSSGLPDAEKHAHNAKERARRMKLSSSYSNLGALLPDFQASKKRWSAPVIVDRALRYIPELQNEVESLTVRKQNMLAETGYKERSHPPNNVTVHEIKRGEMVLQVSAHRSDRDGLAGLVRRVEAESLGLVRRVEAESLRIVNVSTVRVAHDHRLCSYQIHVQVDEESSVLAHGYDIDALRDKVNLG